MGLRIDLNVCYCCRRLGGSSPGTDKAGRRGGETLDTDAVAYDRNANTDGSLDSFDRTDVRRLFVAAGPAVYSSQIRGPTGTGKE